MSEIEPKEYELKTGEKLCLMVFATNELAIRLYRKMGFLEEGRSLRHVKIADGQNVHLFLRFS